MWYLFLFMFERVLCPTAYEMLFSIDYKKERVCVCRYSAVQRDGVMAGYSSLMHPGQTNKTEALRVTL